jgi:acyl phosphate:glycerol-3-phosphate acyltransferase
MLMIIYYMLFIIAAYLFGAAPFMIMIGRMRGVDLSCEPDLHHALWFKVGRPWGALGFGLDIFKGVLPVLVGYLISLPLDVIAVAGLAAMCGQMWPIFRSFDGERGNTVGLGIVATLSFFSGFPPVLYIAVACAITGFIFRSVHRWKGSGNTLNEKLKFKGPPSLSLPLGVMIGYASCPFISALLHQPAPVIFCYAGVIILILIRRVTAGVRADLKNSKRPFSVIINRFLFDRSEI